MGLTDTLDAFIKLPALLQWAWAIGIVIVIVFVGLSRVRRDPPPAAVRHEIDPYLYAMATCDRIERDIHGRFDRLERAMVDLNKDLGAIRRGLPRAR